MCSNRNETVLRLLSEMIYEAGYLEEVQYIHDVELLHKPDVVTLVFQHRRFTIQAVAEDNTISLLAEAVLLDSSSECKMTSVSERKPWAKAIGKKISWSWMLTNQQGYFDSIQFDFSNPGLDQSVVIQLVTIASSLKIFRLDEISD